MKVFIHRAAAPRSRRLKVSGLFIAFAASYALTLTTSFASTYVVEDGVWWDGLSFSERISAVQGMIDGYQYGFVSASNTWIAALEKVAVLRGNGKANSSQADNKLRSAIGAQVSFSKTYDVYVEKVDAFYLKHPDQKSKVRVVWVIGCLNDKSNSNCEERLLK